MRVEEPRRRRAGRLAAALGLLALLLVAACGSPQEPPASSALDDDAITIGSFDFDESEILAQLYGQALQARGYKVVFEPAKGPRELLLPALQQGVIELLPEYAGTALQFVSLGSVAPSPEPEATSRALRQELAGTSIEALDPAPAENANRFVVTRATADRYGLQKLSDLQPVAPSLRFGGPPECPTRPFCLDGLRADLPARLRVGARPRRRWPAAPIRRCGTTTSTWRCCSRPTRPSSPTVW